MLQKLKNFYLMMQTYVSFNSTLPDFFLFVRAIVSKNSLIKSWRLIEINNCVLKSSLCRCEWPNNIFNKFINIGHRNQNTLLSLSTHPTLSKNKSINFLKSCSNNIKLLQISIKSV